MRFMPKISKWFNKPSAKGTRKERFMKEVKGYGKLVAVGGTLSLGAEGVSALVNHAKSSPNMENSEQIEFTDFGPSVIRLDTVDSSPKAKLSFVTMMLICLAVCLCLCYPFLKVIHSLVRHCRIARALKATSGLCPPPLGPPSNDTADAEDPMEPPPSMETYWDKMHKTGSYAEEDQHNADNIRQRVEEEIMSREKADISDVIEKIKKSAAVKAAQRHQQEEENKHQDK